VLTTQAAACHSWRNRLSLDRVIMAYYSSTRDPEPAFNRQAAVYAGSGPPAAADRSQDENITVVKRSAILVVS